MQPTEFKFLNPYINKINEHSDIILNIDDSKKPNWEGVFPKQQPLVIDIGCGAGNFLRDLSLQAPDHNYIGLELRYKRLVKGAIKFQKRSIDNIRLVRKRAEKIDELFPRESVQKIHINFPDPWSKRKQQKHRLINSDYLDKIISLLKKDGEFIFKTDHEDYFQSVLPLIKVKSRLSVVEFSEDLHNSAYDEQNVRTEFEQLFYTKGLPTYYCKAKKV